MKIVFALIVLGVSQLWADVIQLKGSDTLGSKLVPMLCEAYKQQRPELKFEIAAEGTATGLPGLLDGTNDILMAGRALKPEELGRLRRAGITLQRTKAADDAFVIAVNEQNPVRDLTLAQLEGLFTGKRVNWKEVGGGDAAISIYTRNTASGSYKDFQLLAMSGRAYAKGARKLGGGDPPSMAVAKDPNGIGYMAPAYARAAGLAVVKIDGVDPLGKDVARYPLLRHYYYYHRSDARAEVVEFVRWASSSAEARKAVKRIGFLMLEDAVR